MEGGAGRCRCSEGANRAELRGRWIGVGDERRASDAPMLHSDVEGLGKGLDHEAVHGEVRVGSEARIVVHVRGGRKEGRAGELRGAHEEGLS